MCARCWRQLPKRLKYRFRCRLRGRGALGAALQFLANDERESALDLIGGEA